MLSLVVALSVALVGCSSSSGSKLVTEGKLTIGSDCDYPPFISLENGKPVGFEYDLMKLIADDLGLELVYLPPQNFDTLIPSINAGGKMDLAVSSLTITDERKALVDFCLPYFDSNQAVVTMKSSDYAKASDLAGKVVGAQSGTTGEAWAKENLAGSTVKPFNQTSEGLTALQAGEIEAMIFDEPVASDRVANTFTDCHIIQVIPTGEQYGFAVSKENPKLRDQVNASLQKLIDNGTYADAFAKYFDFEPTIK
jgi:polar amino acid transport system substrate-binding protein